MNETIGINHADFGGDNELVANTTDFRPFANELFRRTVLAEENINTCAKDKEASTYYWLAVSMKLPPAS